LGGQGALGKVWMTAPPDMGKAPPAHCPAYVSGLVVLCLRMPACGGT